MDRIPRAAGRTAASRVRRWAVTTKEESPILLVLTASTVVVFLGFGLVRPDFFSVENVRNIGQQTAVILIISVAMTIVIIGRGLDISPGSVVAFAGVVGALLLQAGVSTPLALAAIVLAGAGVGLINGTLIGGFGISPFMATLATLAAARGAALLLSGNSGVAVDNGIVSWLGAGQVGPVPVSVLMAALVVFGGWALMNRTEFGRWVRAVGGNPETARASLIPVRSVRTLTYLLTGAAAGLGAVLTLGRLGSAQPLAGSGLEFAAITAVVIGGTKLSGGEGRLAGTVIGTILLGIISTGLSFLQVPQETTYFVTGGLILLAVLLHRPGLTQTVRGAPRALTDAVHRRSPVAAGIERHSVIFDNVGKRFPGVIALDGISFQMQAGEVLALVGENGAGKSTLVEILAGVQRPDSGSLVIDGHQTTLSRPEHAAQAGLSVIHQHFSLAPELTVTENIFLGHELLVPGTGLLRRSAMRRRTQGILAELEIDVRADARVGSLGVGQRQMVEIAKALRAEAWLVVMDEPTSALNQREREHLYELVARLRDRGIGILYISHRMEEIYELASRAVVLRDGRFVAEVELGETSERELISLMVGRQIEQVFPHVDAVAGTLALRIRGLAGGRQMHAVDVDVHEGELVVLAGLMGSGGSEVLRCVAGMISPTAGVIDVHGHAVSKLTPYQASGLGVAWVPGDRHDAGLVPQMTVSSNLSLSWLRRSSRYGFVRFAQERTLIADLMGRLQIRPASPRRRAALMSGGNQQKVVIGKALATEPRILLLDDPTRGVDVGAKAEIHNLISDLKMRGAAILMVSSDLPEALNVADQLVVLHEGRTVAVCARGVTEDEVMTYAFGRQVEKI